MPALSFQRESQFSMREVFESLRLPLKALNDVRPNGTTLFMLLIGRSYTDVQGHLRWCIGIRYKSVLTLFVSSIKKANPELTEELLFWRLHFTLGTCVFTMASGQAFTELAESRLDQKVVLKWVTDNLIVFLSSGMSAK